MLYNCYINIIANLTFIDGDFGIFDVGMLDIVSDEAREAFQGRNVVLLYHLAILCKRSEYGMGVLSLSRNNWYSYNQNQYLCKRDMGCVIFNIETSANSDISIYGIYSLHSLLP